ncbi:SpoU rRNA Methylase family [Leishmania donovani]|uniref:SpoU rRNA Methylase family protein n=1 Tax=Leishmania donovani TaxID=5661 RepID=A0A504XA35_LEIDO|nr:SpoU rRNA Methylase family protein [Leishmania donovani]CAJ1989320.1 SpoU rRNA Methylase family [Leishmania donovani]VDZ45187.1 SpoU_rRNA_Methylase_family_putative/Pfam:PF00588 [Leishmania donovani]
MFLHSLKRLAHKDFDAWGYHIQWPQNQILSPLTGKVNFVVEDIKFAYNAWSLLRLAMFFGVEHPKVLSDMTKTTPSMDIMLSGNRLFFMHSRVKANLTRSKVRIALTPNHPRAFPVQELVWNTQFRFRDHQSAGVELVLGMENGLSQEVADACNLCTYIPQYGSVGSLSMLSALAIAAHSTWRAAVREEGNTSDTSLAPHRALHGHMPLSNSPDRQRDSLPHEMDLLACSNAAIKDLLEERRRSYDLQVSVLIYNELGDRNIGAVIRNANVFNCEYVAIVNRRRFNRRGALGTHKVMNVLFFETVNDDAARQLFEGYEVWLLYPYYPNLVMYEAERKGDASNSSSTFVRHEDPVLQAWGATQHELTSEHPLVVRYPHLCQKAVFLDDDLSLASCVQDVKRRKLRGILLAVPEEGCSPHPSLCKLSHRVVHVISPSFLPHQTQRGLNPALSTAIALERLRCAVDTLCLT